MGKRTSTSELIIIVVVVVGAFVWNTTLGAVLAICAVYALLKGRGDQIDPPPPPDTRPWKNQRCVQCGGSGIIGTGFCPEAWNTDTHPDRYP